MTDFLPAERARGITIQSAAITFNWPPEDPSNKAEQLTSHTINLIDTPGHADFTFEVLRSLRVLDGAVCILDGVAGVEAQTEKVWTQANTYRIPRLVYVNKLDRDGAAFGRTITEIGTRLQGWPAVCQIPWWTDDHTKLVGVGDVISMQGSRWREGGDGKNFTTYSYNELKSEINPQLAADLCAARIALVELLSEHDEQLVEDFMSHGEDHLDIPPEKIVAALRRCTLQSTQHVFPVFAGASFRNIGVQPLLDAVVSLLPSPGERPAPDISIGGREHSTLLALLSSKSPSSAAIPKRTPQSRGFNPKDLQACALAFKVVQDAKRGVLVYVRVYSGSIVRGASLFNTNLGETERPPRLYQMLASDAVEVPSIDAGQIGVIPGLRHTRTGDTLLIYGGTKASRTPPEPLSNLQLRPIDVPPPVFFASVEPESLSGEKHLKESLDLLLREDPSLSVSTDPETGQTHLAGMGELHLEIARDRLLNDFKAKASMGQIEIGYREAILSSSEPVTELFDRDIAGKRTRAANTSAVSPRIEASRERDLESTTVFELTDNNVLSISHPTLTRTGKVISEGSRLPSHLTMTAVLNALRSGVAAALCRGPKYHFPVHSVHVALTLEPSSQIFPDTSAAGLSNAARIATRAALKSIADKSGIASSALMEPVMLVTISVPETDMGSVMHDLSSARGGQVLSLDHSPPSSEMSTISLDQIQKQIWIPKDPFSSDIGGPDSTVGLGNQRQIIARVPLKEMVGYLKYLRSMTGGRGTFTMKVDKFEKMSGPRMDRVVKELGGGVI